MQYSTYEDSVQTVHLHFLLQTALCSRELCDKYDKYPSGAKTKTKSQVPTFWVVDRSGSTVQYMYLRDLGTIRIVGREQEGTFSDKVAKQGKGTIEKRKLDSGEVSPFPTNGIRNYRGRAATRKIRFDDEIVIPILWGALVSRVSVAYGMSHYFATVGHGKYGGRL
ncbi:uncharacterized protein RAG0_01031 [Rhynchosporium agropyri]|uniref:Uncharacterized protein n=1 Tax=Rhynchosporium agropyri TaxID=914238 RepID=A0A1E1JV88_9HELO|nr:uncharacterized protein RAG0_01031 [Rhynchosporium agropyri]